ncbi:MAG: hypothetical protein GY925_20635 [Actinomycetia bacterium]|nr:hypothetical protein [Actinomycetes bacterium]
MTHEPESDPRTPTQRPQIAAPDGTTVLRPMPIDPLFAVRAADADGHEIVVLALGKDVRNARVYSFGLPQARELAEELRGMLDPYVSRSHPMDFHDLH